MTKTDHAASRGLLFLGFFWGLVGFAAIGCDAQTSDPTGGETHFLRICDVENDPCGDNLSCLCGVCTAPCSVESPCSDYPGAQCVTPNPETCTTPPPRACDVGCAADEDCQVLSESHHCVDGFCRLASSSSPVGQGGDSSEGTEPTCGDTETAANEVVILGDSFLATTHEVTGFLEEMARQSGVLSAGERYRDYSNLVSNSLATPSAGIAGQYEEARAELRPKVVIMNGGGADALLGSCTPLDSTCPLFVDATAAFRDLAGQMADDGVEQLVFVGYPEPIPEDVREEMKVLLPLLESACADSTIPCSWLDLRPVFTGNEAEFVAEDGLNPTSAGSAATAGALWRLMRESCIAQ